MLRGLGRHAYRTPVIYPSLDFNFLTGTLSPQITFTRASSATYFDSTGTLQTAGNNVARFDYNPSTLAAQGLLIEEQRTNLILQSEDFATTWAALNVTPSTNTTTSPAGTLTADTITPAASTAIHLVQQSSTVTASVAYTASVFVKTAGAPFVQVVYDDGASNGAYINVDLSNGAITRGPSLNGTATNATGSVTFVGNGFYRVTVGATHSSTVGRVLISILPAGQSTAGMNPTTTTATTDKIIFWGAQLEAGVFPTSYIPTTSAAATRSADVASVNTLTPWYNATEGTLFAQANLISSSYGSGVLLDIGANGAFGTTEYMNWTGSVWALSPNTAPLNVTSSVTTSATAKVAAAIKANDSVISANGLIGTVDTSCAVAASPTTLTIGKAGWSGGLNYFNGWIQRITYYPTRLPNATLQALTT